MKCVDCRKKLESWNVKDRVCEVCLAKRMVKQGRSYKSDMDWENALADRGIKLK